jgi:hypothetical protein
MRRFPGFLRPVPRDTQGGQRIRTAAMSHEIRLAFEHPAARARATEPDGPLDRISVRSTCWRRWPNASPRAS